MGRLLANWYTYIYDNMYSLSGEYDQMTMYSDAVMGTLADGGPLHALYLFMTTIGLGMLVVYFIITLGTRLEEFGANTSVFFKTLLEFFVGYALAVNSMTIVRTMFSLGDALAAEIVNSATPGASLESYAGTFAESLSDFNILEQVIYAFKALIPYLACFIASLFILYVIVSRVLRICVNAVMSPLAVANFFEGSRRSDAIRFLKRTFAMCLQCSVIMIVVAAVTNLSGYMATNPQYEQALGTADSVDQAKQDMLDSAKNNYSALKTDVTYAVDKLGMSARDDKKKLKSEYQEAMDNLLENYSSVTSSQEAQYKQYENLLGVEIFNREGGSYTYSSDGYALLKEKYTSFTEDSVLNFLNTMLGNSNFIVMIMLLAVKAGMIKQSMSLCNTIVGV